MSTTLVEYVERLGGMWDDELAKELVRVNAAIGVVTSKSAAKPLFGRRRMVEAVIESRKDSVENAIQHNKWHAVPDDYPDADEAVLGLDTDTDTYCVVVWDGNAWGDQRTFEPCTVTHWMRLLGVLELPARNGGAR